MSDININLPPGSNRAVLRHLSRIQRLRQAMASPRQSKNRDSLSQEIQTRTFKLEQQGVKVPSDDVGLRDLIKVVEGKLRRGEL